MATRTRTASRQASTVEAVIYAVILIMAVLISAWMFIWVPAHFLLSGFDPLNSAADRLWGIQWGGVKCPVIGYDGYDQVYDCSSRIPQAAQEAWEAHNFWTKVFCAYFAILFGAAAYCIGKSRGNK